MWVLLLICYLMIGFVIGFRNVSKGVFGEVGPPVTLCIYTLLWPLYLVISK
jgi:F0F1-type ATP synthase assembly protein I